jgi:putative transcriptional regulator
MGVFDPRRVPSRHGPIASRAEFSTRYHVPIGTPRDWEQNRKRPDAPALAYLRVIAREPGMVARALQREAA